MQVRPHASPEQHERAPPSGGYVERCFRRKSGGKGMAMRYARFRDEQTIGADLMVDTLQAAGVRNCYGIVGDTLNRIAHAFDRSEIDWVHMRHEEAGAFAASAEALLTGRLTACAGSCGPGSLHFINGLYEANRNRAPVILIATQIVRQDLGFESIQEIEYEDMFRAAASIAR